MEITKNIELDMSIWGPRPFDNDDGADWFTDLRDDPRLQLVENALKEISISQHVGYLDVADCAEAVAAAELLAELLGSAGSEPVLDQQHEELAAILSRQIELQGQPRMKELIQQAIDAVDIVLNDDENSELRQMWDEQTDQMTEWKTTMTSLYQRLRNVVNR